MRPHDASSCAQLCLICLGVFLCTGTVSFAGAQASAPLQTLQQMYHSSWTIRSGAPSSIEAIAQTRDGFLWLGTDTGLFRFDGNSFVRYHPEFGQDLRAGTVRSLLATRDGGLWISYGSAGASFLNKGLNQNFGKAEGLVSGSIGRFAETSNGTVWAAGKTALWILSGKRWQMIGPERGYSSDHAVDVLVDRTGRLWVATGTQVVVLAPGAARFLPVTQAKDEDASLVEAPDGSVWLSSPIQSRVCRIAGAGVYSGESQKCLTYRANKIVFDGSGSLWIATDDHGVYRTDPPGFGASQDRKIVAAVEHYGAVDGLTSDDALDLLADREGSVWVASTKGIDQFRHAALTSLAVPKNWFRIGIAADGPQSILAAGKGLLHISDSGSQFLRGDVRKVSCVYRSPDGTIWIGEDDGLWRYREGQLAPVPLPSDLDPAYHIAQAITMDGSGGLWVSFLHSGFMYYKDGRWTKPSFPTAAPHEPGLAAMTDHAGRVWFGLHDSIVEVLGDAEQQRYDPASGLSVGNVSIIYEYGGYVWVGGQNGVAFQDGGRFHELQLQGGLRIEGVSGILQSQSGELWINQASGILRLSSRELKNALARRDYRARFTLYNYLDGLTDAASQIRPNPTIVETSSGRLYFSSRSGIAFLDPDFDQRNTNVPGVFIESLRSDGSAYPKAGEVQLPENSNVIEVDYTATSLLIPQRVLFRYKLDGLDKQWQDAGTRRQAFYTGLAPGHYHFRVLASNNDGVWNESGASVDFKIPPSFLQSVWFKILCGVLVLAIVSVLYGLRMRVVADRIKARLSERLEERDRIARDLHDTFFQGIQGLLLSFNTATSRLPREEPVRALLENALLQSDRVMREGRELVLDLRTSSGRLDNFASELTVAGTELAKRYDVRFRVLVHGETRELHPIVFEEALLISKEALANAFRHANADSIEAELNFEAKDLRVCIRDDGIGIEDLVLNSGGRAKHLGLPNMRERAQKIGAHLNLWSKRGVRDGNRTADPGFTSVSASASQTWLAPVTHSRRRSGTASVNNKITVLAVDDHPLMLAGIAGEINAQDDMRIVAQAHDGLEALAQFRAHRPDVTLMDIRMPEHNGIDAIIAIRSEFPRARIVILSTAAGDVQILRAFRAGAVGYLLKNLLRTELLDTIRRVHAGERRIPAEIAQQLAEHAADDALTIRELDVLRGVARGRSNKRIADELKITEHTVKNHIKNILSKLDADDRTAAAMIAVRRGYIDL